jgi:Na+/H+-dicarboxylate symporter
MKISGEERNIPLAVDYVREALTKRRINSRATTRALLSVEELLVVTIAHLLKPGSTVTVRVVSLLGTTEVRIISRGSAFDSAAIRNTGVFRLDEDADEMENAVLRSLFERVMGDNLSVRHRNGTNQIILTVHRSKYRQLILTLTALVLGLLTGIALKSFLPTDLCAAVSTNALAPVSTMFLNALKMIVGPLVFFSIATSIAEFGDIMALGRMFGRIILGYFCTSLVAITIGILVWHVFPIGNPALKEAVDVSAAASVTEQSAAVSLRDTLVGIVPKDIVSPFLNANMLQIIFIAAVVGIAAGMISGKLQVFQAFLADGYLLFSRVATMIIGLLPLAVFCSISKMVLGMNMKTLLSVFSWIPVCYIGCILMIAFYGLMILVFAKLNPLKFFGKYYPVMLTAYTFASSNASLPSSMECCGNALGISRRLYAFSLPLGATINMDGSCVVLSVSALFMTKIFGVPVTGSLLTTLVLSIFVLSIGAPGVPGAALVCLSILLPQIGVPSEAISLIMGLYSLAGMILVCTNVTGDAVMTLIVGKQENQVDLQVYNR